MDQGGTFTDCLGRSPDDSIHLAKVLSSPLAPLACIREILSLREDQAIPPSDIRLGTTLATNALLERRGHPFGLLITEGFGDALEIGNQQRPDLFSLNIVKPSTLYREVVEVRERLEPGGRVALALDPHRLREDLLAMRARGLTALAVVLLHGYAHPEHEKQVADLARSLGFTRISCSHEVNPEIGLTARGDTTTVDAYLTPLLADYVESLRARLPGSDLRLMQSNGGLSDPERFRGHNAILSGPAAGAVACARLAERNGFAKAIGFDMGGTSTDVSRHGGGEMEKVFAWEAGGMRIRSPALDIHTVAAGGGSLCRLRAGRLTVGPESAGSDPGPLCYGRTDARGTPRASEVTVTDVNLFLGRLLQDNFPFHLDAAAVRARMDTMRRSLHEEGQDLTSEAMAHGFLEIVNRQMAQAIKDISLARGLEASDHALICFGGAGGQHACAVARLLGIRRILLHPLGGVLSAFGMGLADIRWEGSAPVPGLNLEAGSLAALAPRLRELEEAGSTKIRDQGYAGADIRFIRRLDLRYAGTEHALSVTEPADGDWLAGFAEKHRQLYGYLRPGRRVEILQIRIEAIATEEMPWPKSASTGPTDSRPVPHPIRHAEMILHQGRVQVPVYRREDLPAGFSLSGPALILDRVATVVVDQDFRATADAEGQLLLELPELKGADRSPAGRDMADAVLLELFNHAFMAAAERMGKVLQRTALSTNIKERLDFSCAVFDAAGCLVANAPHIPVHLGAMGESVRHILASWPNPRPGDVFVTNNPYRGGSHLPDITVVTPVFAEEGGQGTDPSGSRRPAFFTASRAHHADVGGTTPGSMPAFSKSLAEEGVLLDAFKLVDQGRLDAEGCLRMFSEGPLPSRNPGDNLADLEAQAAANQAGVRMLSELVAEHGLARLQEQMARLRANAARQVREALARLPQGAHRFEDFLETETGNIPIRVCIELGADGATVDFTGSGPEDGGNLNAPPAVVRSAVLYTLRCLVAERIPLNEGCLDPVRIILPAASILNPTPGRAVVGGNVETSQRVVDCLLGALGLAAASQGTMNNVTFGDGTFGYYETLAGGAGAGPGFAGADAVHTHMTNTRTTDPEVLETRYPVRLEKFAIRKGSGGIGQYPGGDGVIRQYRFLKTMKISLLTQRRTLAPFGLCGGESGAVGRNLFILPNGSCRELPGATEYRAQTGDALIIETPGGGGWGTPLIMVSTEC